MLKLDVKELLEYIVSAGKNLTAKSGKVKNIGANGKILTKEDIEIESRIKEIVAKIPGKHSFFAEEEDGLFPEKEESVWVIDSISGTKRFIDGKANYAIVVSRLKNGKVDFAAVYNPSVDKLYVACKEGVCLNGVSINRVSNLQNSAIAVAGKGELLQSGLRGHDDSGVCNPAGEVPSSKALSKIDVPVRNRALQGKHQVNCLCKECATASGRGSERHALKGCAQSVLKPRIIFAPTREGLLNDENVEELKVKLQKKYEVFPSQGSFAYNYCLVVDGSFDGVVSLTKDAFPEFAGCCIANMAGLVATNLNGCRNITHRDRVFICGSKEIYTELFAAAKGVLHPNGLVNEGSGRGMRSYDGGSKWGKLKRSIGVVCWMSDKTQHAVSNV